MKRLFMSTLLLFSFLLVSCDDNNKDTSNTETSSQSSQKAIQDYYRLVINMSITGESYFSSKPIKRGEKLSPDDIIYTIPYDCKFDAWYFDKDFKNKFDKEIIVEDDIYLYAKILEECCITFENQILDPIYFYQEDILDEPVYKIRSTSDTTYKLLYWKDENDEIIDFTEPLTHDMELHPVFEEVPFTGHVVNIYDFDGMADDVIYIEDGDCLSYYLNLRYGEELKGLYLDEEKTNPFDIKRPVTSDLTLYLEISYYFYWPYVTIDGKDFESFYYNNDDIIEKDEVDSFVKSRYGFLPESYEEILGYYYDLEHTKPIEFPIDVNGRLTIYVDVK